jgi:hypothetical protein
MVLSGDGASKQVIHQDIHSQMKQVIWTNKLSSKLMIINSHFDQVYFLKGKACG